MPVVNVISSLRLTVVFLCLAVALVFIGTLAQREEGLPVAQRDRVYSIPEPLVAREGLRARKCKPGEIRDSKLPLTVRVRDYWINCEVEARPPAEAAPVGADHGSFTDTLLLPLGEKDPSN